MVIPLRKMAPIHVIFHFPKTEAGARELALRAAELHADAVIRRIQDLNCSRSQKLELLDAVIETHKEIQA